MNLSLRRLCWNLQIKHFFCSLKLGGLHISNISAIDLQSLENIEISITTVEIQITACIDPRAKLGKIRDL